MSPLMALMLFGVVLVMFLIAEYIVEIIRFAMGMSSRSVYYYKTNKEDGTLKDEESESNVIAFMSRLNASNFMPTPAPTPNWNELSTVVNGDVLNGRMHTAANWINIQDNKLGGAFVFLIVDVGDNLIFPNSERWTITAINKKQMTITIAPLDHIAENITLTL